MTIAYSVFTESRDLPVSNWEMALGEISSLSGQLPQADLPLFTVGAQAASEVVLDRTPGPACGPGRGGAVRRHRRILLTFSEMFGIAGQIATSLVTCVLRILGSEVG